MTNYFDKLVDIVTAMVIIPVATTGYILVMFFGMAMIVASTACLRKAIAEAAYEP